MKIKYFCMALLLMTALMGCNQNESNESELALIKKTNPSPLLIKNNSRNEFDLVKSIEKDIESIKELYDVAVVKGKDDTLVAYKVKHLQRFHMKKIEKKMKKMLEEKYPDEKFTVSSDYKIFLEAVKLNEKMKDPNYSEEKASKRLKEIIKLKNEMA
ncbi:hypothetical protein J2Z40_001761 [Cytobacillus eiseniae]|uniref:Sporulation protein n=1 Tax=Cytobacillus eiseniae TaxID=762947 RepID=A0ABS4RFV5_9BACI|nr:sporulation protein [Cytobacillus eiseniae]MBP2241199.1 hypothetical protein [Cytobacillus eiseniae]